MLTSMRVDRPTQNSTRLAKHALACLYVIACHRKPQL